MVDWKLGRAWLEGGYNEAEVEDMLRSQRFESFDCERML